MSRPFSMLFGVWLVLTCGPLYAQNQTVEQLRSENEHLKKRILQLTEIIEGTAHPINLGRTSLAVVSASSVNGNRPQSNCYYGVRNAFDDGDHWFNKINYTYWLSHPGDSPHIDVRFDHPVTLTSIVLENAPACNPVFTFAKGGEEPHGEFKDQLTLPRPVHGVVGVRLDFVLPLGANATVTVYEVRIMGYPPPDKEYQVQVPRLEVKLTRNYAVAMAEDAFRVSGMGSWTQVTHRVEEHEDRYVITFHHGEDDVDLLQVVIDKATQQAKTKKVARWSPLE